MLSCELIVEIDIDPLVVYPAGEGLLALDAPIVTRKLKVTREMDSRQGNCNEVIR
jgi:hypothetical protein